MLTETTTIKMGSSDLVALENALQLLTNYLESSTHCESFMLTRHPLVEDAYLLNCAWDTTMWRNCAWRYFADVFATGGLLFHTVSHSQQGASTLAA
jgi:hypothetical protein